MAIHIGTSGWSYPHWTGVLYPEGLPVQRRLECYLSRFRTVELNASYYRWPSDAAFASWRRRLPADFLLTVKAPGSLTHVKRLYAPEPWQARIRGASLASGGIAACCWCSFPRVRRSTSRGSPISSRDCRPR